jgi:hypothetical protein
MHIQKIVSGIRELQVMHTESRNNEIRRKKTQQKKFEAMIEEKEKDTDFYIEKMKLKKEKDRLIQKKILEREKERDEDREVEVDKARVKSKMELEKKNNKSASLRASRGVTSAITASRLYLVLSLLCTLFHLLPSLYTALNFSLLPSSSLLLPLSPLHFSPFSLSPQSFFPPPSFPHPSTFLASLSFHLSFMHFSPPCDICYLSIFSSILLCLNFL